jgi:hypothetical protein
VTTYRNRYQSAGFAKPSTTAPASERQLSFLADLLNARPAEVTGVTDVPAAIAAIRAQGMTKAQASDMINAIKALPTSTAPAGAAPASDKRANGYAAKCADCQATVEAGQGWIEKDTGRWRTHHHAGQCPAMAPAAPVEAVEVGLYMHDSGHITKIYITQNDNMAAKALIGRSFQYMKGGVRRLRECMAAGTVHKLTEAEAQAFGKLHGFCCNCGIDLDDDRSLAVGYGPVCAGHNGWFYPTYTQASEMLGRPCAPKGAHVHAKEDA